MAFLYSRPEFHRAVASLCLPLAYIMAKSCTNQTNALKFLNFLCKDDIAEKNFEYVQYASPITSVAAGSEGNLMVGANCAGFLKVATAMMAQGITY